MVDLDIAYRGVSIKGKVQKTMGNVAGGRGKKISKEGFLEELSFE